MGFLHCKLPVSDIERMDTLWILINPTLNDSVTCDEVKKFMKDLADKAISYP
jgi:hypothetical protein